AQLAQLRGARCLGVDLDPTRRGFARALRLSATSDGTADEIQDWIAKATGGRGADAVIVTAGGPNLARSMLSWLRSGGTLNIFASFHPHHEVSVDWNDLYYREINIVST